MMTDESIVYVDDMNKTEEDVTRELKAQMLESLVRERAYCEQQLAGAQSEETPDEAVVADWQARVQDVKDQLALIGDTREPRNRTRK